MMVLQQGQVAPARLMVPAPIRLSFSRRWAGLAPTTFTSGLMPNTTPVRSAIGCMVSRTRLLSFFASHRVLSRGRVARQDLQRTVRAQR